MSEKLVPPIKPVGKSDGINKTNSTLTTPTFDSQNGNKNWSSGSEGGSLFKKK